ncbi:MAG: protein kinase [Candidatus Zixiibacteriota bacterium]
MIGKTISHYRILNKLGEGGMGVVYKAEDIKLKRTVALKFLPPQAVGNQEQRVQLFNEARAAAALDHPNICTIHEIMEAEGQAFIAMGYIQGQSLKTRIASGSLKLDQTVYIAIQIAEGLKEAHEKGIIHRDIKSANIMVTDKGQVKIMDFGLAKLAKDIHLTSIDRTVGTAAYMSPEQCRGDEVDHRTDIWSLGIVLYEMLTGQFPFKGEYEQAVIYSILNEEPGSITSLRPDIPTEMERIVKKTLEKNADSRYQMTSEVITDLKKLRKKFESDISKEKELSEKPQPSIAVLPFTNLSGDKEQEFFCDGMAEEIINALAHVEGLRVVARTSAFSFRGQETDIREIGRKLSVENLLEGSVRKAGNRVRITAQLINVEDGYHLWSEKYDRDIGDLCCPEDIFGIQDEISLAIVDNLKVKLLGDEKKALLKRSTENLEAYNLYLKGRYHWNKRTPEGLNKAIEHFKQAIEMEPLYALAYAGLADCYSMLEQALILRPQEAYPKAKAAAEKALKIDNNLGEAHASLGLVKWHYEWDWEGVEREFKRAIELNPNYASAHQWYGVFLVCNRRYPQGITEMTKAQELDPLSPIINVAAGWLFLLARQYDQAIEQSRKALDIDPNFGFAYYSISWAYEQKGMHKEAIEEYLKGAASFGLLNADQLKSLRKAYSISGYQGFWQKHLDISKQKSKRSYVPAYEIASIYARLGNGNQALEWLQKAFEERDSDMGSLLVDPFFDSLRTDTRFKNLLKKMGLEK